MEQFASFQINGSPTFSTDPTVIQSLQAWTQGWSASQFKQVFAPYVEDRNAVDLVNTYQLAYLLQQGIAEWDSGTVYYTNSIVSVSGQIFISLQDSNVGNAPPNLSSNSYWKYFSSFRRPFPLMTQTVYATPGTYPYTSPAGAIRLHIRVQGGGGGAGAAGGSNGQTGGTSSFATDITCNGGQGGQPGSFLGGSGGTGQLLVNSSGFISQGENGGNSANVIAKGGDSKIANGGEIQRTANDIYPPLNSGAGGGGIVSGSAIYGGGAGAYGEVFLYPPPNGLNASVTVGAAGNPGSPYNNSIPGAGASGIVIVDEYYF